MLPGVLASVLVSAGLAVTLQVLLWMLVLVLTKMASQCPPVSKSEDSQTSRPSQVSNEFGNSIFQSSWHVWNAQCSYTGGLPCILHVYQVPRWFLVPSLHFLCFFTFSLNLRQYIKAMLCFLTMSYLNIFP